MKTEKTEKPKLKFSQSKKRLCEICTVPDCDNCSVHKSLNAYRLEVSEYLTNKARYNGNK